MGFVSNESRENSSGQGQPGGRNPACVRALNTTLLLAALCSFACGLDEPPAQTVDSKTTPLEATEAPQEPQCPDPHGLDCDPAPAQAEPSPAELEAVFGPRDDTVEADPIMLAYCRGACLSTAEVWEAFCRVVPHPGVRIGCWGTFFLGQASCQAWCYWHWGT